MATIKVKRSAVAGRVPATTDLELGEIAINTYDGVAYIKKSVSGTDSVVQLGSANLSQNLQNRYQYTATANQTTFAANYLAPYVDVYLNGIRLIAGVDYTATTGTNIVLATGASLNNVIDIVAYTSYTANANFADLASVHVTTALGYTPENPANKGVANGYASLNSSGQIPSAQLPSFVDDVVEYANLAALPATGESGKIYVTQDTNKTYRWSGSAYTEIASSPGSTDAVTEGSSNLYFTNARARNALSATQNLTYNSSTGVFTGPDLSGYLTSATAATVYAPLASPSFSGSVTLSSGTANGIPYLNASNVLTSGSTLRFTDGALFNTQAGGNNQTLLLNIQNSTSGTTAGSAMYWGNDASQFNAIITKWSSIHSTKPNYFEINNVSSAPITFGVNNTERFRIGSTGEWGIGGANYGTSGQVLTSGGSGAAPTWSTINALPSQTGNTGKYLTTDGTTASWATVSGGGGGGSGTSTSRTAFTATAAQTTFTVSYVVGQIDVYMNGSKLLIGTDVTATSGTNVVLASGAAAGDIIETVVYSTQWITSGSNVYYSAGNVGIGTASPESFGKFAIRGSTTLATWGATSGHFSDASTGSLYITHSNNKVSLKTDADLELFCNNTGDSIIFSTNAAEKVRIDSSGNVGIGITSPTTKLDVVKDVSSSPLTNGVIRIVTSGSNPATGNGGGLLFAQQDSNGTFTNYASIVGSRVNSASNNQVDMLFSTGSINESIGITERIRITGRGVVGIGDSNPSANAQRLSVNGPGYGGGTGSGLGGSSQTQYYFGNMGVDNSGSINPVGFTLVGGGGGVPRGFILGSYGNSRSTGKDSFFFTTNAGNSPWESGMKAPAAGVYRGSLDSTTFAPNNTMSFLVNNGAMTGFGVYDVATSDYDGTQKAGVQVRLGGTYGGGSPPAWGGFCYTAYINTNFGSGSQGTNWGYYADISAAGSGNNWAFYAANGNAAKPGGGSWTSTSDARVKNVVGAYTRGLAEILQVNPVNFEYNGKGGHSADGKQYTNVIAQEVQQVFPEMVSSRLGKLEETDTEDTQILMVDNSALVYALVNSVKELKAMVDAQSAEIAALKGQING